MPLPTVSIITTCKGRLHHLRRSLPAMLAQDYGGEYEIVVVDYDCPDLCGQWVESRGLDSDVATAAARSGASVKVVRVEPGHDRFNPSHARNVGAAEASGEVLCFVDADVVLDPRWLSHVVGLIEAGARHVCIDRSYPGYHGVYPLVGTCAVRADAFRRVWYDEQLIHWGREDIELYARLDDLPGGRGTWPDVSLARAIEHDDGEALRHFPDAERWSGVARNVKVIDRKARAGIPRHPNGPARATDATMGVLTACDRAQLPCVRMLLESLRRSNPILPVHVVGYDLDDDDLDSLRLAGASAEPVEALAHLPVAGRMPPPAVMAREAQRRWKLCKPWVISGSPWDETIWIDADCIVTGDLRPLFDLLGRTASAVPSDSSGDRLSDGRTADAGASGGSPVLTSEHLHPSYSLQPRVFWAALPALDLDPYKLRPINSGVLAVDKERDAEFLRLWRWATERLAGDAALMGAVGLNDQATVQWAAAKLGIAPLAGDAYNAMADGLDHRKHYRGRRRVPIRGWWQEVRDRHPGRVVVHYLHRPKLPDLLGEPRCERASIGSPLEPIAAVLTADPQATAELRRPARSAWVRAGGEPGAWERWVAGAHRLVRRFPGRVRVIAQRDESIGVV